MPPSSLILARAPARAGSSRESKHKFRHMDQPVKTQSMQIRQTASEIVLRISETFRKLLHGLAQTVTQVATKNLKEYRPSLPFWPDEVLGTFVMHLITMGRRRAVSAEEYRAWAAISALHP
ncbi:hypothetical protein C8J57DRAFT_1236517 [Mycena rebaudengoi]|nr:hypothetical protein C8J57DRAFT_1236517 [Mycena rebaudengoi]